MPKSDRTAELVDAVFTTVARTAPEVRASLVGRRQYEAAENPSGERQLEADIYADGLFEERLLAIDGITEYASEERDGVIYADGDADADGLSVAVDPLDGSSNLKSNNSMGTIVAVYDAPLPCSGEHLLAAAYVLYGPITTMVTAQEGTVREYVITDDGRRQLVEDDVTLPDEPVVYGFGGRHDAWTDAFADYAEAVRMELKLRYGGAMIADISQVLTYGGVFAYPALTTHPNGKLRLLFEGIPIGYIIESAGGRSSNGGRSLLAVPCEELHQRVPVHVGNDEYIERLERALAD